MIVQSVELKDKKISCKDKFEDCYLRHKYLKRVKVTIDQKEMTPYEVLSAHVARNTYYTYLPLFEGIGFELEDIVSICKVHLVSFLGLYSLEKTPEKYEDFILKRWTKKKTKPTKEEILDKNKANCTLFLKQRMEDFIRICKQKGRNIFGSLTEEFYYYSGKTTPPTIFKDLIKNYEKLGFKKIDAASYRAIRKKANTEISSVFIYNDTYYVSVPTERVYLSSHDLFGADLDYRDNPHNFDPERALITSIDIKKWEDRKKEFDNKTKHVKIRTLKNFIKENAGKVLFKQEVTAARKLLKTIGV